MALERGGPTIGDLPVYLACAELGVGVTFVGGVDERMLGERDGRSIVLPPEHALLGMLTLGMSPKR